MKKTLYKTLKLWYNNTKIKGEENSMITYSEFKHNYDKSPYPYREPISEDYRVFIGDTEIPVYTCRISKMSFNRVWPGYQRSAGQTDLVSFINIVSDEPVDLKVKINIPYEKLMLKPYSKNIEFSDNNGEVTFTLKDEGQFVLAADDFHHILYIFNTKPIEAPAENEVTYYFGPGVHMPGKITLHDNESIYVDKDALVFGNIFAENAKNLHIFGNGLFDDSCEGRIDNSCYEPYTNGNIKFYDCENIRVEGVLFRDSAIWCVNVFHCDDAVFDNIKVFGQWRYNTDGVDIVNSKNITVKNSFIHSFDDTITIKGIDRYADTSNENIITDNCVLWCDWGNTCEIGIETLCHEYKNIVFRNCDIIRAGNVALDVNNGECAEISDIVFENINVEYNVFDSPTVYQQTEDMEYAPESPTCIASLIRITNGRWRTEDMCNQWNVPFIPENVDLEGAEESSVHHVTINNINVYYDERIPKKDGKYDARIHIKSKLEGVKFHDISISGITINGEEIDINNSVNELDDMENFVFTKKDEFAQMKKNDVSSANQLKKSQYVSLINPEGKGKRIMFVGNSITLHGILHEIGWHNEWGMAASSKDKDYVHQLISRIDNVYNDAVYCICQVASWEREYKNGSSLFDNYTNARDFDADIIVMRFIENCPYDGFEPEPFKKELGLFLDYLNKSGNAKIIMTTGFWKHPGDDTIREYAKENNLPLAELGDLGEQDEMKAIGLFEHNGVANHPGDKGMEMIAKRIFELI